MDEMKTQPKGNRIPVAKSVIQKPRQISAEIALRIASDRKKCMVHLDENVSVFSNHEVDTCRHVRFSEATVRSSFRDR